MQVDINVDHVNVRDILNQLHTNNLYQKHHGYNSMQNLKLILRNYLNLLHICTPI